MCSIWDTILAEVGMGARAITADFVLYLRIRTN